jgi:hypothetical protein
MTCRENRRPAPAVEKIPPDDVDFRNPGSSF